MMDPVINTLGLDKADMTGKIIAIEEQHGCDGTFLISSILSNALKKDQAVCLVLYHNTFNHYHNVGMRLGYNLISLKEKGQLTLVEPMNDIAADIEKICQKKHDASNRSSSKPDINVVYELFSSVKEKYYEAAKYNTSVVIIIDDLSHMCDLGLTLTEIMFYLRYLKSLVETEVTVELCILCHSYQKYSQTCTANAVANCLRHMGHLLITTEPLQSGHSNDASGRLTISWKPDHIRRKFHWPEKAIYLYKLLNRQVKIFAPGMVGTVL